MFLKKMWKWNWLYFYLKKKNACVSSRRSISIISVIWMQSHLLASFDIKFSTSFEWILMMEHWEDTSHRICWQIPLHSKPIQPTMECVCGQDHRSRHVWWPQVLLSVPHRSRVGQVTRETYWPHNTGQITFNQTH